MVKVGEGCRNNMYSRLSPRNALEKPKFWRPLKIWLRTLKIWLSWRKSGCHSKVNYPQICKESSSVFPGVGWWWLILKSHIVPQIVLLRCAICTSDKQTGLKSVFLANLSWAPCALCRSLLKAYEQISAAGRTVFFLMSLLQNRPL